MWGRLLEPGEELRAASRQNVSGSPYLLLAELAAAVLGKSPSPSDPLLANASDDKDVARARLGAYSLLLGYGEVGVVRWSFVTAKQSVKSECFTCVKGRPHEAGHT